VGPILLTDLIGQDFDPIAW